MLEILEVHKELTSDAIDFTTDDQTVVSQLRLNDIAPLHVGIDIPAPAKGMLR